MVRLLPRRARRRRLVRLGFNPTMVRLLPIRITGFKVERATFQSHNGAIAASIRFATNSSASSFQSHNGAIAANVKSTPIFNSKMVSIPQWCDCCIMEKMTYDLLLTFQSHNGAIAAKAKFGVLGAE